MATGTIQGTFGWSNAPLAQGMREAEQIAARGASTVSQKFQSLFKRDPGKRAETALTGFITDLSSGNVAGAIGNITGRMSAFGLVAGVALGAGISLFQKFKQEVDETTVAEKQLANELATLGGTRGPEEIAKKFEAITSQTAELIQKSQSAGSRLTNFLDEYVNPALGTRSKHKGKAQDSEIGSGFKAQEKLLADRAAAEEKIVDIREAGLKASEQQAAIEKILYQAEIKKSAIAEEATKYKLALFDKTAQGKLEPAQRAKLIKASGESAQRRTAAVDKDTELSVEAENQKFAVRNRALAVEQDLANMAFKGVQAEQQKLTSLSHNLGLIEDQLKFSTLLTEEAKKQLHLEETKAKTALRDEQLKQFMKPPQQLQNERDVAGEHQRTIKKFEETKGLHDVHRDMGGNVIGGYDPTTGNRVNLGEGTNGPYKRSPEAYGGLNDPVPQGGMPYRTPTFGSNLGGLDTPMPMFGGSQGFNDFFHPNGDGTPQAEPAGSTPLEPSGNGNEAIVSAIQELKGVGEQILQIFQ